MKLLTLLLFVFILPFGLFSQIVLNQTTAANYVANICGPGITFSNVTLTGDANAIRAFTGAAASGLGATMNN